MTIKKNKVVSFHYSVTNEAGEVVDSSRERKPMTYFHGANSIVPGLEKALEGRSEGDAFQVTVTPAEAYGERDDNKLQRISSKHFRNPKKIKPGQMLVLKTRQGPIQVMVLKVGRFNLDVDANHPLAGQTLTFDVEVTGIRDATKEEIAHGHAHGDGGVEH
jgi:FKBP-type peptidyl-prolyl cis-trans isomerase SlyD